MTTETHRIRTAHEATTHSLFAVYLSDGNNWSVATSAVRVTFEAMWHSSLPLARIVTIGNALANIDCSEETYQQTLTRLVRAKVLRSRVIAGVRHWEVNY